MIPNEQDPSSSDYNGSLMQIKIPSDLLAKTEIHSKVVRFVAKANFDLADTQNPENNSGIKPIKNE